LSRGSCQIILDRILKYRIIRNPQGKGGGHEVPGVDRILSGQLDTRKRPGIFHFLRLHDIASFRISSFGFLDHGNVFVVIPWGVNNATSGRRATQGADTTKCGDVGCFNVVRRLVMFLTEGGVQNVTTSF